MDTVPMSTENRTLTPRQRSRAVLDAMDVLDPVLKDLSTESRVEVLRDLQKEYVRTAANGAKGTQRRKP